MIDVTHFGLHRHDNLAFLHEQDGGRCLTPGLERRLESPLKLVVPHWLRCPHRLGDPEPGDIVDHPFARAMGPAQEGSVFHVYPQHLPWLRLLGAMTPGTAHHLNWAWGLSRRLSRWAAPLLTITNAAPLIVVDLKPADYAEAERAAELPRHRNLILCGALRVPGAQVIEPKGLDHRTDWAAEGRRQLHHLVRSLT